MVDSVGKRRHDLTLSSSNGARRIMQAQEERKRGEQNLTYLLRVAVLMLLLAAQLHS
jgi:hypothetical protein